MSAALAIEFCGGAEHLPFASMMAELLRANLSDQPKKRADFDAMRGRVTLIAEDAEVSVTLRFTGGKLSVHKGFFGLPDLIVRGSSGALIDLSRLPPHPLLKVVPDLRSEPARALLAALRARKLRITGWLTNPGLALRFSRLLSIY